jgi:hypothetical protein
MNLGDNHDLTSAASGDRPHEQERNSLLQAESQAEEATHRERISHPPRAPHQGNIAISHADVLCGRGKASFHHGT